MEGPLPSKKSRGKRSASPPLPLRQTMSADEILQGLRRAVRTACGGSRLSALSGAALQKAARKLGRSTALRGLWLTLTHDVPAEWMWLREGDVMEDRLLYCAKRMLQCPENVRGTHEHLHAMCVDNDAAPHLPEIVKRKTPRHDPAVPEPGEPAARMCMICAEPLPDKYWPGRYHADCRTALSRVVFVCMLALEYAHAGADVQPQTGTMEEVLQRAITETRFGLSSGETSCGFDGYVVFRL